MTRNFRIAVLLFACILAGRAEAFRYVQVGDPAPPLPVEDLGGKDVQPSLFGRHTVVLFWRPRQSFSSAALRDVAELAREFQGQGVVILAIADPAAEIADLSAFAKQQGFSSPFFIDRQRRAQEAYGVIVFPSTGIVGKDGRLHFYQPSRNSNYKAIIGGKLKVLLGLMQEQEYEARLTRLGETFVGNGKKAQDHYKRGLALFQEGKNQEAAREFTQAMRLSPTFQDARLQLGNVWLEMGNVEAALKEFQSVQDQNPLSPSARIGMGIAYLRLGKLDTGIRLLEEAVSMNPNPVRGYAELGKAYEAKGDLAKAMHFYKRAITKLRQGRK